MMCFRFSFQTHNKQIHTLLTASAIRILSASKVFHGGFAKEKNLEHTLTLQFVINSSTAVLEDKMLKHALLVKVSIRFFAIVTGQGF